MAAKSRRAQFEEQLRSLQDDISSLSRRLSIPSTPANATAPLFTSRSSREGLNGTGADSFLRMPPEEQRVDMSMDGNLKGQTVRFKRELHILTRERDDALHRLHQAEQEIQGMGKSIAELNRWKMQYDRLLQENEALKVSLDSSERIRKQQKDLISLLQRSNAAADHSVLSFNNSVSSIHTKDHPDNRSSGDFSSSVHSVDAENRSWLNGLSSLTPARPHITLPSNSRERVTFMEELNQPSKLKSSTKYSQLTGRQQAVVAALKKKERRPMSVHPGRSMTVAPSDASAVHQRRLKSAAPAAPFSEVPGRPPKYPKGSRPSSAPPSTRMMSSLPKTRMSTGLR